MQRSRAVSDATALLTLKHVLAAYHPALSLPDLVDTFGPLIFPLYRAALLRKRILLVGDPPVELSCNFGTASQFQVARYQSLIPKSTIYLSSPPFLIHFFLFSHQLRAPRFDLALYSMLAFMTCHTSHHFQGSLILLRSQSRAGLHAQLTAFLPSKASSTTFLLHYLPHILGTPQKRYIPRSPYRYLLSLAANLRNIPFCKLPNETLADT
jgi:hypothetical protein